MGEAAVRVGCEGADENAYASLQELGCVTTNKLNAKKGKKTHILQKSYQALHCGRYYAGGKLEAAVANSGHFLAFGVIVFLA